LKLSPDSRLKRTTAIASLVAMMCIGFVPRTRAELTSWLRNIEAGTSLEAAFFRLMTLPNTEVFFRRPPSETRPALTELLRKQPDNGKLYALRALEDEQQLDNVSAEADWKNYLSKSADKPGAELALADFYHRRLRPSEEITALAFVAAAPATASERFVPASEQRSWQAFERIFRVLQAQGSAKDAQIAQYRAWIARYPREPSLYPRFLDYLLEQKDYLAANQLIEQYQKNFPDDDIFHIKAQAMLRYRQGSIHEGLAVYERTFQPLWDPELVKGYFELLTQTQNLRKFLDQAQAALVANPEDLGATARIFYYYQQQGKLDVAEQAMSAFRLRKEAAHSAWKPQELYFCGRLLEEIHAYPESARYYFALYSSKDAGVLQETALSRLTDLLLSAPESSVQLGSGNLAMYKDIATLDQGPGYLNGILSLLLNSTTPAGEYAEEEQRAISYFHRARAAELLALLGQKFPNAADRPELHAKLLDYYATIGRSDAVLAGGKRFLADFPHAAQRLTVSLLMAEAHQHLNQPQAEFAIYDKLLQDLAKDAEGMPLGVASPGIEGTRTLANPYVSNNLSHPESNSEYASEPPEAISSQQPGSQWPAALQISTQQTTSNHGPHSPGYSRALDRYLARLVQLGEVPRALGVLRREIDRNPDDPGRYERLAVFLEQNKLGSEQEEVYRRAIAKFSSRSWYQKLARYYLRYRKDAEYQKLSTEAIRQFDGSDLENYFRSATPGSPQMYLELNQYAHDRFPHNPWFVGNLLIAYHTKATWNHAAWEALLRQHWFEDPTLRNEFFEYLSFTGKLDAELSTLEQTQTAHASLSEAVAANPSAAQFTAQAALWHSRFEQAAPILQALSTNYPADPELGRTASSVFRSLACFDPKNTAIAVDIERHLLDANPGNTETLARIGDIYADRAQFANAAPYWDAITKVTPSDAGGYLQVASIYWDYYDFPNALRLLQEGRTKLHDDHLYGYEAGAIYEGQRDYAHAASEYASAALTAPGDSPALSRLLLLARRPQFRDLVNQTTENLADPVRYGAPALNLRVSVLEVQNRLAEIPIFLKAVIQNAQTSDQIAAIENIAQQKSLEEIRQLALEKQVSLASDPVTRLQLRYQLVRLLESRKDLPSAQKQVAALYGENPTIAGVVRATVDFYWRAKQYSQAIEILQASAKRAYPELAKQYLFEAARKSIDAHEFPQSRTLLATLLKDSPYDGQYLSAMAETYAQAGDQLGLKNVYLNSIALLRNAPLTTEERKNRTAAMRRGVIPALTKLQDYSRAVDQYIEIINAYPEDEALVAEATLFAQRHNRHAQLLQFYVNTVKQSPRDPRWPVVVACIDTNLEDLPSAIDAYGTAIAIRPDRADLRIARAALTARLLKFDDAISDYARLYQLTYKDPQWMEKIAELRARQGKNDEAVAALKTALIDGQPDKPENYFAAAHQLEAWGILEQARVFAEQGVSHAGSELLVSPQNQSGANVYAHIMTRLRLHEKAWTILQSALSNASSSAPILKEQFAKEGIAAISDREWRERQRQLRIDSAQTAVRQSLAEMGATVAEYFTPEEKSSVAAFARSRRNGMNADEITTAILPVLHSAGLGQEEADTRYDLLTRFPTDDRLQGEQLRSFIALQRQRLKFADLASQLEALVPNVVPARRPSVLIDAAEARRAAGDTENELRLLSIPSPGHLSVEQRTRLFALLLGKQPQDLVRIAASSMSWAPQATDYILANGDASLAQSLVAARGRDYPSVWRNSYSSLVALYFGQYTPLANTAFLDVLGDKTIGERLGHPVDRQVQLAGDLWYYYGSRYGEFLDNQKLAAAADYLPAGVEQSPASTNRYASLADYYFETGNFHTAFENYQYALQLSPARADLHDRLAVAYNKSGLASEAIAEWKRALAALAQQLDAGAVGETFWTDFARICEHAQAHHVFAALRSDADLLLRTYLHRNANFRSAEMLHAAYVATSDPVAATSWLLQLTNSQEDSATILSGVVDARWISLPQRERIYRQILQAKQEAVAAAQGAAEDDAKASLRSWQLRRIKNLLDAQQFREAQPLLAEVQKEIADASASGVAPISTDQAALLPLELRLAAKLGTMETLIESYKSQPGSAPSTQALRAAIADLSKDPADAKALQQFLQFVFQRELDNHNLAPENFLGLAELRVATGDITGAVALLHRLETVSGDPYEDMDSAAALLKKAGRNAEAIAFLQPLAEATPWKPEFRLRLAQSQIVSRQNIGAAQGSLQAIASSSQTNYLLRASAASNLHSVNVPINLGSPELNLLATAKSSSATAASDQPFFFPARLRDAGNNADANQKMTILSNSIADITAPESSQITARLQLFYAAASQHSDDLALASIESLLQRTRLKQTGFENTEDANSSTDTPAFEADRWNRPQEHAEPAVGDDSSRVSDVSLLSPAEESRLAQTIGHLQLRQHHTAEALAYLQGAQAREEKPARRKYLTAEIRNAKTILRREQENAERQPTLHPELEQNHLVRPRLLAGNARPKSEGAQP
jgi:tetratricopeptide (TPR) repeat protein